MVEELSLGSVTLLGGCCSRFRRGCCARRHLLLGILSGKDDPAAQSWLRYEVTEEAVAVPTIDADGWRIKGEYRVRLFPVWLIDRRRRNSTGRLRLRN
jgi:hypothetical protein